MDNDYLDQIELTQSLNGPMFPKKILPKIVKNHLQVQLKIRYSRLHHLSDMEQALFFLPKTLRFLGICTEKLKVNFYFGQKKPQPCHVCCGNLGLRLFAKAHTFMKSKWFFFRLSYSLQINFPSLISMNQQTVAEFSILFLQKSHVFKVSWALLTMSLSTTFLHGEKTERRWRFFAQKDSLPEMNLTQTNFEAGQILMDYFSSVNPDFNSSFQNLWLHKFIRIFEAVEQFGMELTHPFFMIKKHLLLCSNQTHHLAYFLVCSHKKRLFIQNKAFLVISNLFSHF